MNFYFGHIHTLSRDQARQHQIEWLNKTIFPEYKDCISTHVEDGFSLTLVNDPKDICPYQSNSILVNDDFVCTTDCRLFNKVELATELDIDPKSQNEVFFVSAFLKWGREFPNKFDGRFSFVIWDRNHKSLLAGLDHLGYGSFSYSHVNHDTYFSSDLATLLDQPNVDKSINMKRFYQCFRYSNNTPEQTSFQHCYYCPPSHVLKIDNRQFETIDYWKLIEKKHPGENQTEFEYTQEFISLLQSAIGKEIKDNEKTGLMLSGGYDSSLLAAVLAENQHWKRNLTCYSYVFEKFKSCDESTFISKTLDQLKLQGKLTNADDKSFLSDTKSHFVTKDVINMDAYNPILESIYSKARQDQKTVLITGLNGDDLFAGVRYMFADLLKKREYGTIIIAIINSNNITTQLGKFLNFGIRPLLPDWVKYVYRRFFNPDRADHEFNIDLEDINTVEEEKSILQCGLFQQQKLLKLVYYRNLPESLHFLRKRLYLKFGIAYLMPYYTKEMIEFMWTLPLNFLEKKGVFRGIQISALNCFHLKHITERLEIDKTSFVELVEYGVKNNRDEIKKMVHSSLLTKNDLISEDKIGALLTYINQKKNAFPITYFIMVELWFEKLSNSQNSFNHEYIN